LILSSVKTLGLIPNSKKQTHSTACLLPNKTDKEVKVHVILVGAMGTIYKDYTDKPLADLNLDYHKIKILTHKLNE